MNTQDDTGRLQRIEDRLNDLIKIMMPRSEIESAIASRVSLDAHQNVLERLDRLENAPQRGLAVVSLWVSGGIGCLSILVMLLSVIVGVILHFWR